VEGLVLYWRALREIEFGQDLDDAILPISDESPDEDEDADAATTGGKATVMQAATAAGFQVLNLRPNTPYAFFAVPFFRTLCGLPSNAGVGTTMEDGKAFDIFVFRSRASYTVNMKISYLWFYHSSQTEPQRCEAICNLCNIGYVNII